jgi:glutamine kinase
MECIILAAGKDQNSIEKIPKCLRRINDKTILDCFIELFKNFSTSNINLVGGFEILQIMEKYPDLKYYYNSKWPETKSLYSLSKVFKTLSGQSLITYSDIIHKNETLELIDRNKINIFYDSVWKNRYENRDLNNLEKIIDNKGRLLGEFAGLMYIPSKELDTIKFFTTELLEKNIKATVTDLINTINKKYSISFIDVSGNWAELDSMQDIMHFKFGTKAETLKTLKKSIKKSFILEQHTFTVEEYLNDQKCVIQDIQNNLSAKLLVVRSSALNEDTEGSSMAGSYESILKVEKDNVDSLTKAIEIVIKSYIQNGQEQDLNNQILTQPYLENVTMSGVVFSKNLQTSSPYYTVNYDNSNDTATVTSGSGDNLNTFVCYNNFESQIRNERLSILISAIKEIEEVTKYDAIDVEFAFVNQQLYILQVRPIAAKKKNVMVSASDILSEIIDIKAVFDIDSINLLGSKKAYGIMPDWNPAEIIGTNPRKLSYDLYSYLITDNVWAKSRAFLGYKKINNPGLISLGGKPYVDIQMSFNTFVPDELNDEISAKLVDYFVSKLERNPQNHDKVEFFVAITSFDFDFDEKIEGLISYGFSKNECAIIVNAYKNLTQKIVLEENLSIKNEIDKTLSLVQKREKILNSNLNEINKIYLLLEDCKKYGTFPFSNLARCGFIGSILLKSLLNIGCISVTEYDEFLKSIHTVAKEFINDIYLLSNKKLSKEIFIDRYGHLRPGTYDISSKSYKDGFHDYIDSNTNSNKPIVVEKYKFSRTVKEKISHEILKHKLDFDVDMLINFIIKSTEAREKSKFEFTKSLCAVLDLIGDIGKVNNINVNDLSHVSLDALLQYRNGSSRLNFRADITNNIEMNKRRHVITCSLNLPELVFSKRDVEMFHLPVMRPNFITHHNLTAESVFLVESNCNEKIDGKIVCIENADPGYDWIFSHNIAGLITKYGGVASHMSIRCAEFDLPAAIGCGEQIFNNLSLATKVSLDCANKKIRCF